LPVKAKTAYNEPASLRRAKELTRLEIKAAIGWSREVTGTSEAQGSVTQTTPEVPQTAPEAAAGSPRDSAKQLKTGSVSQVFPVGKVGARSSSQGQGMVL